MTTIYLARHATPDWSQKDIPYHVPPGPPLVEKGLAEAQVLGEFFREVGVRQILSSPLERCLKTAQIAAREANAEVEVIDDLREVAPGENQSTLSERVWSVFEAAQDASLASEVPVALVTHGAPVAALLEALGMSAEEVRRGCRFDRQNVLPPAGAWLAEWDEEKLNWRLELALIPEQVLESELQR